MPGIILEGGDQRHKRFYGYTNTYKKQQIEDYLRPHLERANDVRNERDTLFKNLTHDLRAISTEIYHEALAARDTARYAKQFRLAEAIDLVLSSQQMMSVRLNIVDYESEPTISGTIEKISVFRKVEKVFLSFQRKLRVKKLTSSFTGTSFSTVSGPDILDIALFVLIENAIKYSPIHGDVVIHILEDDNDISISVESWGPCIAANEKLRIFDRGFRGAAAENSKRESGAGVGLYAASAIIKEHFQGSLTVDQSDQRRAFGGAGFYRTIFRVRLPIAQKVAQFEKPSGRFRRRRIRFTKEFREK